MGRQDFGRSEFALPFDDDYIGAVPDIGQQFRSRVENGKIVPGSPTPVYLGDVPDAEVKDVATYLKEKHDARRRGTAVSWDADTSTLTIYAFYNNLTAHILNKYMAEAREQYGKDTFKYLKLSLAVEEARDLRFELHRWQFSKIESESNARYWMYRKVLGQKRVKPPVVDVRSEPKPVVPELKPPLTVDEFARKQEELERLRAHIAEIERLHQADTESAITGKTQIYTDPSPSFELEFENPNGGFVEVPPQRGFNCSICNKPVDLETAKTDDDGKTVHEECYVMQIMLRTVSGRLIKAVERPVL